eukprot:5253999-Prorocentrum_lima.AAC.1
MDRQQPSLFPRGPRGSWGSSAAGKKSAAGPGGHPVQVCGRECIADTPSRTRFVVSIGGGASYGGE